MASEMVFGLRGELRFDVAQGRIGFAGQSASYLPVKFLTGWLVTVEQSLGMAGLEHVQRATAEQFYHFQEKLLGGAEAWRKAQPTERLLLSFDLMRLEGWGRFEWEEITSHSGRVWTRNNAVAEAYLENMQRWMWPLREVSFCAVVAGRLQAAVALAGDLSLERVSVVERTCLTVGADRCSFRVEVD